MGIKIALAAGAAAGNVSVPGIQAGDRIESVQAVGLTEGAPNTFSGFDDLTDEFDVTAADTINNAGGTSSAGKLLVIAYESRAGGRHRTSGGRSTY